MLNHDDTPPEGYRLLVRTDTYKENDSWAFRRESKGRPDIFSLVPNYKYGQKLGNDLTMVVVIRKESQEEW